MRGQACENKYLQQQKRKREKKKHTTMLLISELKYHHVNTVVFKDT